MRPKGFFSFIYGRNVWWDHWLTTLKGIAQHVLYQWLPKTLTSMVSLWFFVEFANVIKSYTLDFINSSEALSQLSHWLGWCHRFYEPVSNSTYFLANPHFFRLKYSMPIFIYSKYIETVSDPLCKYRYEILDQWLHILYHTLGHSSAALLFLYSNDSIMYRVAVHEYTQLNEK